MARIKGIYGKQLLEKTYKTFPFEGVWEKALGNPEVGGFWIIYGREKQGKTWFSLMLAEYLSKFGCLRSQSYEFESNSQCPSTPKLS